MIIIGIILAFIGLAYLCWLVFSLAIYALPFFAGASAGLATYHNGSGPIAAIIVGAIAGSITLIAGQIAFTTLCSPLIRAAIGLLFAVPPAAVAEVESGFQRAGLPLWCVGVVHEGRGVAVVP